MTEFTLVSTIVAPAFTDCTISVKALTAEAFADLLPHVTKNMCGHPLTIAALTEAFPNLPPQERGFWDGRGVALAARPKGGVRGAVASGDTAVSLADLEFVEFTVDF